MHASAFSPLQWFPVALKLSPQNLDLNTESSRIWFLPKSSHFSKHSLTRQVYLPWENNIILPLLCFPHTIALHVKSFTPSLAFKVPTHSLKPILKATRYGNISMDPKGVGISYTMILWFLTYHSTIQLTKFSYCSLFSSPNKRSIFYLTPVLSLHSKMSGIVGIQLMFNWMDKE